MLVDGVVYTDGKMLPAVACETDHKVLEVANECNRDFTSTTGGPLTIEFLNYNQIRCCNMDAALKIVTHLPLREL